MRGDRNPNNSLQELFSLEGRVAVVTGATGVLGGAMARGLARAGAKIGVLGRRGERAEEVAREISALGGEAAAVPADVLDEKQLREVREAVLDRWGRLDVLVNAAGGNVPGATLSGDETVFDLAREAFGEVFDLNLVGTLLPIQVLGEAMTSGDGGCILNVSSMAAARAITRVAGYSAAKAAVDNLTRWLAVDLARRYGDGVRVNAIAPGFFIGEQNRAMLLEEDGSLTDRGRTIVEHTPAGRFGEPDELVGAAIWLCSPAASFVNGAVIPVDGGFGAFSGV
ncbi:MAG: D-mannonate oxidoreductase [uncultured Rubrobacteraceae bacterium]|uniref:D-mannonate oxidoreductase n=1 Tax=uncultured Rubrobacteraceae bacterium TaxID=349277 RepID=A0A6J4TG99_9ACTN|nr:MAG: D-mannonate oxidoreductase [uncultured Rubrobacteraceae bacterium]